MKMQSIAVFGRSWSYFVLAFAFSWLIWLGIILTDEGFSNPWVTVLYLLGGLGPAVAAMGHIYFLGDINPREYWDRVFNYRRLKVIWISGIIILLFLTSFVPALLYFWFQTETNPWVNALDLWMMPLALISAIIFNLAASFFEELGWRGYALDSLQEKNNAFFSSLVLGVFWALWHLPQFFIPGTFQHDEVGFASIRFWIFMAEIISQTILITWLYNNNKRSILSAIIFHFFVNFFGEMFSLALELELVRFAIFIAYVLIIVILFKPQHLTKWSLSKKQSE